MEIWIVCGEWFLLARKKCFGVCSLFERNFCNLIWFGIPIEYGFAFLEIDLEVCCRFGTFGEIISCGILRENRNVGDFACATFTQNNAQLEIACVGKCNRDFEMFVGDWGFVLDGLTFSCVVCETVKCEC